MTWINDIFTYFLPSFSIHLCLYANNSTAEPSFCLSAAFVHGTRQTVGWHTLDPWKKGLRLIFERLCGFSDFKCKILNRATFFCNNICTVCWRWMLPQKSSSILNSSNSKNLLQNQSFFAWDSFLPSKSALTKNFLNLNFSWFSPFLLSSFNFWTTFHT